VDDGAAQSFLVAAELERKRSGIQAESLHMRHIRTRARYRHEIRVRSSFHPPPTQHRLLVNREVSVVPAFNELVFG